jgi:hypothetical protein
VLQLLVNAKIVPSSPILVTLIMEAIHSSETSVLTRPTRHHKPEDGILHISFIFRVEAYREIGIRVCHYDLSFMSVPSDLLPVSLLHP